jgi:hypothetical protein
MVQDAFVQLLLLQLGDLRVCACVVSQLAPQPHQNHMPHLDSTLLRLLLNPYITFKTLTVQRCHGPPAALIHPGALPRPEAESQEAPPISALNPAAAASHLLNPAAAAAAAAAVQPFNPLHSAVQ